MTRSRDELTVEAARAAGLENVTLLEEPQAAFYAWLAAQGDSWRKSVKVGDILLVCDVGGGTTDFTLIAVSDQAGDLTLTRQAVGEHILLGGDNMDLALAHAVAGSFPGGMDGLDAAQRVALGYACRTAKETLFAEPKKAAVPVSVLGRGSKVIGGSLKTELTRETLKTVFLDGFLPKTAPTDLPARGRRVGLTEIGLPYAADPAITRHLARFLGQQAGSMHTGGAIISPSAVLFNGGVFKAAELRSRVRRGAFIVERSSGAQCSKSPTSTLPSRWALLLRPGPPGQGGANSWRRAAVVLHRDRVVRAGCAGYRTTDQGCLRCSDGDGGRNRGRCSRPGVRPGCRRTGGVSVSWLNDTPR